MARMSGSWEWYNAVSSLVHQPDGVGDCPGAVAIMLAFQVDEVWIAGAQAELVANSSKGFQGFYSALFSSPEFLKWKRDAFKIYMFKYVDIF